jgi:hypothetical protein
MKFPAYRVGLAGNDLLFYIVPLDPAYPASGGTGHAPVTGIPEDQSQASQKR